MDISTDIASQAIVMKQAQVQSAASTMMLKKNMNAQEQIATNLIDQLMQLPVGDMARQMVDVSI